MLSTNSNDILNENMQAVEVTCYNYKIVIKDD